MNGDASLENMKIRVKLITGFTLVLALLLIVSVVSIVSIANMSNTAEEKYEYVSLPLSYISTLYDTLGEQQIITRDMALYSDQAKMDELSDQLTAEETKFEKALTAMGVRLRPIQTRLSRIRIWSKNTVRTTTT